MPEQKTIEEAEQRSAPTPFVVYEAVKSEGEQELRRSATGLFWSALAAGLSMGFSLIAEGLLTAHLPQAAWRPLIAKFGYSIGFLVVVLGRQQLFTENTVTVILPLLEHPDRRTLRRVARLWAVVLGANLLGALLIALALAKTGVFDEHVREAFRTVAESGAGAGFGLTLLRGVFAGWLIALMVWLMPGAETARVGVIILITYVIGLGGFAHVIAGSVEKLFLVASGHLGSADFLGGFLAPALLGNILGGVALVAALNFGAAGRHEA
jgi:formate/nitrite transporter FocA (FNT family)